MKSILSAAAAILSLALSTPAQAQTALSIDPEGIVRMMGDAVIAGTLSAKSVQADNLNAALAGIKAQNDLILQSLQWTVYSDTVNAALTKINAQDALEHEFGILQDGDFREAKFSAQNQGMMLITDPYMVSGPGNGNDASFDRLGGTVWFAGTIKYTTIEDGKPTIITIGCTNGSALHMHYTFDNGAVKPIFYPSDVCEKSGKVYARKRLFR